MICKISKELSCLPSHCLLNWIFLLDMCKLKTNTVWHTLTWNDRDVVIQGQCTHVFEISLDCSLFLLTGI